MKITCQVYLYQQYCLNFLQFLCYFSLDYVEDNFSNVSHIDQGRVERCCRQIQGYYSISDEHYAGEGIQINCRTGKNGEE